MVSFQSDQSPRERWLRPICCRLPAALLFMILLFAPGELQAVKIGDLTETHWWSQAVRFWSLEDASVRYALLGSIFIGTSCGLLGSFIVMRKLSLMGDMLSHAVLPGVALGFLWNLSKDPIAIFIGATFFGLLSTVTVNLIKQTTPIKEDSALGMVLAGFYAVGICLFTMIQRLEVGNKSGIDKYMFGQAAALSQSDVLLMGIITLLAVSLIILFYRHFLVTTFDQDYAHALGIPAHFIHYTLMILLAFAVVVSLQATGIVLVSAMLIIPAASAYLLTDRMHQLLILAVCFGITSAIAGAFFSFLGNDLPTGPFMVIGAASVFVVAFLFGPRHGLLPRWTRQLRRRKRIRAENTLKSVYQVVETLDCHSTDPISVNALASRRNESVPDTEARVNELVRHGLATLNAAPTPPHLDQEKRVVLTAEGWLKACEIVRNHRLWELYLTNAAHYELDHVHDDAEKIEHILGEATVRELERRLNSPQSDPHGKPIPSQTDIDQFRSPGPESPIETGYRQPI